MVSGGYIAGREIDEKALTRRSILSLAGWSAFALTVGSYVVGTTRFFYPRVLYAPSSTFKAGFIEEFPAAEADQHSVVSVSEKWKKEHRVWIVREKDRIYAIAAICTHLGCTPNWMAEDRKFFCPCHGSLFYSNGVNFAGPAPRPLDRYKVTLTDDGQFHVDKSVVFSSNSPGWNEPPAVVKL